MGYVHIDFPYPPVCQDKARIRLIVLKFQEKINGSQRRTELFSIAIQVHFLA
jgi:hypothetical protein